MKLSPSKTHTITHAVHVGHAGGALQGSWDVPSAHSIDRTSAQFSVTDQFEAATAIQRVARGHGTRDHVSGTMSGPGGATIYDLSAQIRQGKAHERIQPGKAPDSFELRDAYAVSPYGMGYAFVNNRHDQFGSTEGFNESKTSALADPKPTAQMRVKSGYTGHVPKGRDHIGSTYRMHDNRGSAGKTMVPIPNQDIAPPQDEVLAKAKRNLTYHAGLSHVDTVAGKDHMSTIPVPTRVQKIFQDPHYHIKGGENFTPKAYLESKNPMTGYTGHVSASLISNRLDAGFTFSPLSQIGWMQVSPASTRTETRTTHVRPCHDLHVRSWSQVPFARDIIGTTFYGPTDGNFHHGPAMPADPIGFVRPQSPNKCSECP